MTDLGRTLYIRVPSLSPFSIYTGVYCFVSVNAPHTRGTSLDLSNDLNFQSSGPLPKMRNVKHLTPERERPTNVFTFSRFPLDGSRRGRYLRVVRTVSTLEII